MPDTPGADAIHDETDKPLQTFRILVVDDEIADDTVREIKDTVGRDPGVNLEVVAESSFTAARELLIAEDFDVVVLDVMRQRRAGEAPSQEDPDAGTVALDLVKQTKFVPVIFYTARHLEVGNRKAPPFVQVVSKDDVALLPDAVRTAMRTGIQLVIRELRHFVDVEIRDFLWNEVTEHPDAYNLPPEVNASVLAARIAEGIPDKVPALVHALARAASPHESSHQGDRKESESSRNGTRADARSDRSGEATAVETQVGAGDPAARYLIPPVSDINPGSILRDEPPTVALPGEDPHSASPTGSPTWWVVLTPACDFAQSKVQLVLLARAFPVDEFALHITWTSKRTESDRQKLHDALVGRNERYMFLPAFRELPNLVVDFQHLETVTIDHLRLLHHVAALTSPFNEALLNIHARYRGRIGTPDMPKPIVNAILAGN